jgi:hypothetical protein
VDTTQCDVLERDSKVQVARVYLALARSRWVDALSCMSEFTNNEANHLISVNSHLEIEVFKAVCLHRIGDSKRVRRLMQDLNPVFADHATGYEFWFDTLKGLAGDGDWETFRAKWFPDFKPPDRLSALAFLYLHPEDGVSVTINLLPLWGDVFSQVTIPLFFDLVRQKHKTATWPSEVVSWLETVLKTIIPTAANFETDRANPDCYKELKRGTNQLAFDNLIRIGDFDRACKYIEETGVDYIRPSGEGFDRAYESELFDVECVAFPFYPSMDEWLGEDDVNETAWMTDYSEVWSRTLRYLTKVDFYSRQLQDATKRDFQLAIEDRILALTEEYLVDRLVKESITRLKIPPIVSEICKQRKDWQKAYEYTKIANVPEEKRRDLLANYRVNDDLFDEARKLSQDDQKLVLLYIRLVLTLERRIRSHISSAAQRAGFDIAPHVRHILSIYEASSKRRLPPLDASVNELLNELTLPELFELALHKDVWKVIKAGEMREDDWRAAKTILGEARVKIAHAKPMSSQELESLIFQSDRFLQRMFPAQGDSHIGP